MANTRKQNFVLWLAIALCALTFCLAYSSIGHAEPAPGLEQYAQSTQTITTHKISRRHGRVSINIDSAPDPKPSVWCAWWLRRYLHIPRSKFPPYQYNMARAFARIGSPAPNGCVQCIAVFSRGHGGHVGIVESWNANGDPVILSGNFNNKVATAPHPASRLIALRWYS